MIIDISKIILTKNKSQRFDCSVESGAFDYQHSSFTIKNSKPFELNVINEDDKQLVISADTSLVIVIPCDRCLEDVDCSFDISINKAFRISKGNVVSEDEDISYIDEGELDVDRLLFDEILVSWPPKVLCKENCLGICPKCGTNLNVTKCDCNRGDLDPRMAKFQDVFKEFKEV